MDIVQARQIWAELVAEAKNSAGERQPDEVTIDEFSREAGVSRQVAREFLEVRVRKGKLRKRKLYLPDVGSTVNLYAPAN